MFRPSPLSFIFFLLSLYFCNCALGLPTSDLGGSSIASRDETGAGTGAGVVGLKKRDDNDAFVATTVQQTAVAAPGGFHEAKAVIARVRRKWGSA